MDARQKRPSSVQQFFSFLFVHIDRLLTTDQLVAIQLLDIYIILIQRRIMHATLTRNWFTRARLFLIVLFVGIGSLYSMMSVFAVSDTGMIESSDSTMTGRLLRNGTPSTCDTLKTSPGLNDSTAGRHYDTFTYVNNSSEAACVTVALEVAGGGTALFSAAYLNSFDPNAVATNYLGDAGLSGGITAYSMTVPSGQTVIVVVHEVNVNAGLNIPYTVTIGLPMADQSIAMTPPDDVTYGDPAFPVSATASSGLTVTLASNTPDICTTTGLTVTPTSAGTCEFVATQEGD
jgi:hypothetical protein